MLPRKHQTGRDAPPRQIEMIDYGESDKSDT